MEYDVVVAGGGPAGIGAAVAAGRNGARALLVEGSNSLGGMLTQGLVPMIRTAGDGGGVVRELCERLATGRCISSTRPANGSLRLQPTCMNTGQAAGTAAALCARAGIPPRQVRGEELRGTLIAQGMEL